MPSWLRLAPIPETHPESGPLCTVLSVDSSETGANPTRPAPATRRLSILDARREEIRIDGRCLLTIEEARTIVLMTLSSFAPIIGGRPEILIVGSMPGKVSLEAEEYYAHPRNAFWPLMAALDLTVKETSYGQRTSMLIESGIALWDVLARCERTDSLDASIVKGSEIPNDISALLSQWPSIRSVWFNGATAEAVFDRLIRPHLPLESLRRLSWVRLPSTSPAHALAFEHKLSAWRGALDVHRRTDPSATSPES